MDPKGPKNPYAAPPAAGALVAMDAPASGRWGVDDHVVSPEGREELVRGRVMVAAPARAPHGDRHNELDYVVRGSVAPGFVSSTDLLTRVSAGSDFATDTCIRREGIDPATGRRWLEELAFEVVAEQSVAHVTVRARELVARGVRRVIAIFVKRGEVSEWSQTDDAWRPLSLDSSIEDPTLVRPLPVRALLDSAEADRAVVRGLQAKNSAAIEDIRGATRQETLEQVCEMLGVTLDANEREGLAGLDAESLRALLGRRAADDT